MFQTLSFMVSNSLLHSCIPLTVSSFSLKTSSKLSFPSSLKTAITRVNAGFSSPDKLILPLEISVLYIERKEQKDIFSKKEKTVRVQLTIEKDFDHYRVNQK